MMMKKYLIGIALMSSSWMFGQSKMESYSYNTIIEIKGTEYVYTSCEYSSKLAERARMTGVLFVNTITAEERMIELPDESIIRGFKQIKLDSLKINVLLMKAQSIDLKGLNGIDWSDPSQLFLLSCDGRTKLQLTPDSYFVQTWGVNESTGRLVITGSYLPQKKAGEKRREVKRETFVYDLKTWERVLPPTSH